MTKNDKSDDDAEVSCKQCGKLMRVYFNYEHDCPNPNCETHPTDFTALCPDCYDADGETEE